ncbi:hypothetical protein H4696_001129 [Amycolatopsis lexingtonensis]|uniref:DUF2157 domain-containing protein n=1 Tax=Amycolatopsis lexingtonensis TaxID=218822 RepID=A0ABR9HSX4_9PSEU|nr:DUF2157 domain-containing protein [Amycolatopsis lexingtonensis]MBE1494029.1 hypothetical protein [Amycolatopsis lexingtonensis]
MTRESPVREALERLVEEAVLSPGQAAEVERALRGAAARRPRIPWAEVAGYLGGGLLLIGTALLMATSWTDWSKPARTAIVAAATAVLLAAGVVAAHGFTGLVTARLRKPSPRLRVSATLLALAAGSAAATVVVALPDDAGSAGVAVACGLGTVLAVAGYLLVPFVIGLLAATGLLGATVLAGLDATAGTTPLRGGLAVAAVGLLLAGTALADVLPHRLTGLGLGAAIALFGAQQPLGETSTAPVAYVLTFAFGTGFLVLYRRQRTWSLLIAGVLGITLAVPEAVWDLTGGAAGGAVIVLTAGAVLLAASGIGFRLRRDTQRAREERQPDERS